MWRPVTCRATSAGSYTTVTMKWSTAKETTFSAQVALGWDWAGPSSLLIHPSFYSSYPKTSQVLCGIVELESRIHRRPVRRTRRVCKGAPVHYECAVRLSWHVSELPGQGGECSERVRVHQSNVNMLKS